MDLQLLEQKVDELLREREFRLASIRFIKEEDTLYLRVIVDKYQYNISLDEIVEISEAINAILDEEEDGEAFTLDVTTTGAEKEIPLAEIALYQGLLIKIVTKDGVKGPHIQVGVLEGVTNEELTLSYDTKGKTKTYTCALSDIKTINRAVKI